MGKTECSEEGRTLQQWKNLYLILLVFSKWHCIKRQKHQRRRLGLKCQVAIPSMLLCTKVTTFFQITARWTKLFHFKIRPKDSHCARVRVNSVTLPPNWWSFPQAVWFTARTTTRTRMAVCRTRTRITIRRTRTRTSGLVSQTTKTKSIGVQCRGRVPNIVPRETSHSNSSQWLESWKIEWTGRVW